MDYEQIKNRIAPCDNTGFDKHLYDRSVEINRRIALIGIENYYEEIKDNPRY